MSGVSIGGIDLAALVATLIPNVGYLMIERFASEVDGYSLRRSQPPWISHTGVKIIYSVLFAANFLQGYSSYIVWRDSKGFQNPAMAAYVLQILLFWAHCVTLFRYQSILWSLISIICVLITATSTAFLFFLISEHAGEAMVPYVVWLIHECFCNYWRHAHLQFQYEDEEGTSRQSGTPSTKSSKLADRRATGFVLKGQPPTKKRSRSSLPNVLSKDTHTSVKHKKKSIASAEMSPAEGTSKGALHKDHSFVQELPREQHGHQKGESISAKPEEPGDHQKKESKKSGPEEGASETPGSKEDPHEKKHKKQSVEHHEKETRKPGPEEGASETPGPKEDPHEKKHKKQSVEHHEKETKKPGPEEGASETPGSKEDPHEKKHKKQSVEHHEKETKKAGPEEGASEAPGPKEDPHAKKDKKQSVEKREEKSKKAGSDKGATETSGLKEDHDGRKKPTTQKPMSEGAAPPKQSTKQAVEVKQKAPEKKQKNATKNQSNQSAKENKPKPGES